MIHKALLTASALALSTLAYAPAAQSQRAPFIQYCVDLQTDGPLNIMMDALDSSGSWSNIYYVITHPSRRCQVGQPGTQQVRITIRNGVGGTLRNVCVATSPGDRNATLLVTGTVDRPVCNLTQQ